MDVRPIKTEADYEAALAEIERLWNAVEGTPDADRLDILATLVEAYEAVNWPIETPDPISAIKFRMEQQGLKPKDLVPILGQRSRVYEVLNRRRALSMAMAYRLHKSLNIPAEALLIPIKLRARPKAKRAARAKRHAA